MIKEFGKIFLLIGILFLVIGIIFIFIEKIKFPFLKKFGSLPGDIKIKGKNFTFYFPLASCIILSIILSLIFWVVSLIIRK